MLGIAPDKTGTKFCSFCAMKQSKFQDSQIYSERSNVCCYATDLVWVVLLGDGLKSVLEQCSLARAYEPSDQVSE
jgi:hypothetical protein